jgi:anaerobic magnesium-protoporphyrin IX monomethyl ester cyclase
MKILLINPFQKTRYPQPPLGLAMLAAVLEPKGHSVTILDLTCQNLPEIDAAQIIDKEKPDVVGITAMTSTINSALKIATTIKQTDQTIIVVLGGPHASILPEETLMENPAIDFVVRGEGERTLVELVDALFVNANNFNEILGLTFRGQSGVASSPPRPPIINMDELPFPAFHLLSKGKYRLHPPFGRRSPAMPIMISRGCPYSCIFCSKSVFGNKYRHNSPQYVVNQIQSLIDDFGVREIKFYDDVFTLDKKWVTAICEELKQRRIDIPWTCETRVNLVDFDLLKTMHAAGCYMIAYGVESGDQGILNQVGKCTTLNQIDSAFNLTHKARINTVGYFMLGAPNETPCTIQKTIDFAKVINPDFVQFSIATPYPGTELNRIASQKKRLPKDWNAYVYANLKSAPNSAFEISDMSIEELRVWNKKAYTSFYLRRSYVWKRLKKMRSWGELKTNASGLHLLLDVMR